MIVDKNTEIYVGDTFIHTVYQGDTIIQSNYIPVEYLEGNTTGRQWIDTGVYFDQNTWMELEVMSLTPITTSGSDWHQMLGALSSYHASNAIQLAHNSRNNLCPLDYGTDGTIPDAVLPRNVKVKIKIKNGESQIGDVNLTQLGTFSGRSEYSMWLFGYNRGDMPFSEPFLRCRIYWCKIYQGDELIRDFIPVLNSQSQKVPCMYDKVNRQFYYNQGEYNFIPGLSGEGYVKLNYIIAKGNSNTQQGQYIDTGFKPNNLTRVVMKLKSSSRDSYWFGALSMPHEYSGEWWADNVYAFCNDYDRGSYHYYFGYGYESSGLSTEVFLDEGIIEVNQNVASINGVVKGTLSPQEFQTTCSLFLFKQNRNGEPYGRNNPNSIIIFEYCKIWDNNELVRDFIPVLDKQGIPCLYDKVTKTYFYNQGTGQFLYG